jgi:hypothetical protein
LGARFSSSIWCYHPVKENKRFAGESACATANPALIAIFSWPHSSNAVVFGQRSVAEHSR